MNENKVLRIPYWLLKLLPMWDYICPRCKHIVDEHSTECPFCHLVYLKPLKVPPSALKNERELSQYVHNKILPKLSQIERAFLTTYFTTYIRDGFETNDYSAWTATVVSGTGILATSNVLAHHGAYSSKTIESVGSTYFYINLPGALPNVFSRAYVYFASGLPFPVNGDRFHVIAPWGANGIEAGCTVQRDAGTTWFGLRSEGITTYSNVAPVNGQWYCIETEYNGTLDVHHLWIDGILKVTQNYVGAADPSAVRMGIIQGSSSVPAVTLYHDCCVVADLRIGCEGAPKGTIALHAKIAGII